MAPPVVTAESADSVPAFSRLARRLTEGFLPAELPVALTASGVLLTNRDFLKAVTRWYAAFSRAKAEGLLPRTALYSENTVDFAAAAFGAWRAGVETLLLADALPSTMTALADSGLIGMCALEAGAPGMPQIVPAAKADITDLPLTTDEPLPERNVLVSLLTSGSTGEPKRVPKRLDQLFLEVEGIDRALDEKGLGAETLQAAGRTPPVYATVTHQHIYGILWRMLWPLLGGGLLTAERLHFPEKLAAALAADDTARGFMLVSSPAHLRRFDDPTLFAASFGRALMISSSAGPLDDVGAGNAEAAFGLFPFEVFGSTETGGIARRCRSRAADGGIVTPAWRPMPGVEIGIVPDGRDTVTPLAELVRQGADFPVSGTIALRTRQLASNDFEAGSDLIRLESDARFTLCGRADRIVKVEGKRMSLTQIEKALEASPLVTRARALFFTGRRDEIAAAVELSHEGRRQLFAEGKNAVTSALRRALCASVEAVALPRRWRLTDKFPVNPQGKTTASALTALFDPRLPEWHRDPEANQTADRAIFRTTLGRQLAWFNGHFPDLPILPGVSQITMASGLAKSEFGIDAPLTAVRQLKFKAITTPGMTMQLELVRRPDGGIRFTWIRLDKDNNKTVHSEGILTYGTQG